MIKKAVFLDRDGTLIVEKHYLKNPELVQLEQGVVEALQLLTHNGYDLFIVTNQSGIAKGLITPEDFYATQVKTLSLLQEHRIAIKDWWHCPHHPGECGCRKPSPGMIVTGMSTYELSPENCWMVGDKVSDAQAGCQAGIRSVLVATGHCQRHPDFIQLPSMQSVAHHILSHDLVSLEDPTCL